MKETLILINQGVADEVLVFRNSTGAIKVAKVYEKIDKEYLVNFDGEAAVVFETENFDVFACQTHGEKCVYKHHQVVNGKWRPVVWENDPWIEVINKLTYDYEYKERRDLILGIAAAVLVNRARTENIPIETAMETAYEAFFNIDMWKLRTVTNDINNALNKVKR